MAVIIGGSGSTGSSLLKNLLNNHPSIFGGTETSLFAKKALYTGWSLHKHRILYRGWRGLPNYSWHYYRGVDLIHSEFGWQSEEIRKLISQSGSFPDFAEAFFSKPVNANSAAIWIEKTPSNAACFLEFLKTFKNGKVIHITRDPYDTVFSLLRRGFDLWYAIGIYMLNTSAALSQEKNKRYHLVKYEELVTSPVDTLNKVCDFLGLEYTGEMLEKRRRAVDFETKLKGWEYDETGPVEKGSIGRFAKMGKTGQSEIEGAFEMVYINRTGQKLCGNTIKSMADICKALAYPYRNPRGYHRGNLDSKLRKQQIKNRQFRLKKACPKSLFCPISIK